MSKIEKKRNLSLTGQKYIYFSFHDVISFRFYWSINIGAAISYIVVSYICQYGIPQLGGVDWGFFVGYMIPVIFLTIAIVIFVLGTPRYRMPPPNGSVIAIACGVCWTAIVNTVKERSPTKHMLDRASVANGGKYEQGVVDSVKLTTRLLPFLLVLGKILYMMKCYAHTSYLFIGNRFECVLGIFSMCHIFLYSHVL